MTVEDANALAAAAHVKHIVGPTMQLGDGSYFDFAAPEATDMTIEDYAWGLASANRFRGQTRQRNADGTWPRRLYNVCQHVVLLTEQLLLDGYGPEIAFEGLMHESDEVPWGDFVGPAKALIPTDFRKEIKRSGDAIDAHFGVTHANKDLIKMYDIRMLATEKRDLMPLSHSHDWGSLLGYEPFDFEISCWDADKSTGLFLALFHSLWRDRREDLIGG